jgi:hypothetical protein
LGRSGQFESGQDLTEFCRISSQNFHAQSLHDQDCGLEECVIDTFVSHFPPTTRHASFIRAPIQSEFSGFILFPLAVGGELSIIALRIMSDASDHTR